MAPRTREVDVEDDDIDENKIEDKKVDDLVDPEDDVSDEGPDNAEARRQAEADERRSKRRASDNDDEDDGDTRLAYDDIDDEDGGQRQSRRQKRNRARREAKTQSAQIIAAQDKRIADLEAAIIAQGRNQLGLAAQDVDGQIAEERRNLAEIDRAISRAVSESNGDLHAKALRLRDEASQRINALAYRRSQLEQVAQQQLQQPVREAEPKIEIDPRAEAYSDRFMERHPWFDPLDATDEDSQIVKAIDDKLVNQGYNPNTKRYWLELERRVEARGLGRDSEGDDVDDDDYREERPPRRQKSNSGGLPPRSRRGGDGDRPSRQRDDDRTLPALARDTLDQLGLLEKKGLTAEQLKEREKYITTWRKGLKEAREAQGNR